MRICLFEDKGFANLEPLSLTRPVFDLLCGLGSLAGKQCRYFAPCEMGMQVRPQLAELTRLKQPCTAVNDTDWLRAEPTVLVNGRWLPPSGILTDLAGPCVAMVGDEVAWAYVLPDRLAYCSANTIDDCVAIWKTTLPIIAAGGKVVRHLWELVHQNGRQIGLDFADSFGGKVHRLPSVGTAVVGPVERVLVDPTAQIEPYVAFDTTNGPVVIEREAAVTSFSRLEGPCYIGAESHVLGAKVRGGTTIGQNCRVGGEVEASIIQGHSNKYHDGFLGHSYVGEWVNVGAGTQTSDLRNDYGEVTVTVDAKPVPTGSNKVGSFIGDHAKFALGCLLNTGSNVGAFCNVLPNGQLAPKYIPSFCSWWKGELADHADLEEKLRTADEAMRRRGSALTGCHRDLYVRIHEETAGERRRVLRENTQRLMRRSA